MAHISQIKDSRFIKKEDIGPGKLVTIHSVVLENVAPQGQPEEKKYVIWFEELDKPMVLNTTNAQLIAAALGGQEEQEETDNWPGHKVVLYIDPTVQYAGKIIGGIRVRPPKPGFGGAPKQPVSPQPARRLAPTPQTAAPPETAAEDAVPF